MDDLEYELLSWLKEGARVLRPREPTREGEEAFREMVMLLARLRDRGLVDYLDSHVTRTEAGIYLMVGPVELTPTGEAALERDRGLGARPPLGGPLPWRT